MNVAYAHTVLGIYSPSTSATGRIWAASVPAGTEENCTNSCWREYLAITRPRAIQIRAMTKPYLGSLRFTFSANDMVVPATLVEDIHGVGGRTVTTATALKPRSPAGVFLLNWGRSLTAPWFCVG